MRRRFTGCPGLSNAPLLSRSVVLIGIYIDYCACENTWPMLIYALVAEKIETFSVLRKTLAIAYAIDETLSRRRKCVL